MYYGYEIARHLTIQIYTYIFPIHMNLEARLPASVFI